MNLDRGLIKSQAKELIRGKVMKLFLTAFVVELCIAVSVLPFSIYGITHEDSYDIFDSYGNYFDSFDDEFNRYGYDYDYEYDDDDYFNQYEDNFENFGTDNNSGKSDFYNYGTSFVPTSVQPNTAASSSTQLMTQAGLYYLTLALEILFIPLTVSLAYYFVLFIRGREFNGVDGIKFIFKETFSKTYGKKLGTAILRGIFIYLLSLLFFIPGIIFHYSSYFAYQIICDNPQLSPMQAIQLSKKMIKGNRTELFVLDLSFIPWVLLCVFLFPAIYVMPYMQTTQALYYENFRLRAIAQGRVTEDDFLTDAQKMQKYANQNAGTYQANPNQQQGYAQANPNAYQYAPQNAGYYTPPQNNGYAAPQPNAPYASQPVNPVPPQSNVYSAPQENVYTAPQQNTYNAPAEEPVQQAEAETAPAEEVKPSEKYTPVTPPTENYNNTKE